jgi:23S rRNA U2552 (ribose-2'-O)-methylase RlmE/FtsJ
MEAVAMHIHKVYIAKGEPSPLILPAGRAKMLDIGMAPGGFLQAILEINKDGPDLAVTAITLPPDQGGHENLLARSQSCEDTDIQLPTEHDSCKVIPGPRQNVHIHQFDITMLAGDLGMTEFPSSHPHRDHRETLLPAQPFLKETFDLVICGCQIVHSLDRIDGPKHIEQVRNFTSQLAIGLDHLARHGTIIVLMHNFEAWRNAHMIWLFRQLTESVEVVKPDNGNNRFCTAYMIAQRVDTARRQATQAVERWRDEWKTVMFQTEEDYTRKYVAKDEAIVDRVLHDIGPHLQIWGQGLWRIQADAWERYLARFH